jgi:hypothetical protein
VVRNAIKAGSPEDAGPWLDEALQLAHDSQGPPPSLVFESGTVGLHALLVAELDRAQVAFEKQLRLCREHAVHHAAPLGLAGLAAIAAFQEEDERAACLLGAATAIGPVDDADVVAQLNDRFFTPARGRLGKRDWDEARAAGAHLSLEQAITLALAPGSRPG